MKIRMELMTAVAAAGLLAAATTTPSYAADKKPTPPHVEWVKSVPLDLAIQAVEVAIRNCRAVGKRGSFGVMDMDGQIKVLVLDDNANEVGQHALVHKMYTALLLQQTTWPMIARAEPMYHMRAEIDPEADVLDKIAPGGLVSPGGYALTIGDQFVGVLGAGGTAQGYGPGSEAKCAEAGGDWFESQVNGKPFVTDPAAPALDPEKRSYVPGKY